MKHTLIITLFIIVQLSNHSLHAQSNFHKFEIIKGKVLDDSTGLYIPFVNIFNESKRNWDYTTEDGSFNIWTDIGDTLVYSAVGYLSLVIFVTDSLEHKDLIVKLEPRTYEIGEVTIKSFKTYSGFKQDFLDLELPQAQLDSVAKELSKASKAVVLQADSERKVKEVFAREKGTLFVISVGSLASSIMNKITEKQNTNPKKAYKNEQQQQIIASKFNSDIVHNVTKLNNNELIDFIIFCDFSSEFLVLASQYEIMKAISDKFKEYKRIHQ